jgi:hypothetical protein
LMPHTAKGNKGGREGGGGGGRVGMPPPSRIGSDGAK